MHAPRTLQPCRGIQNAPTCLNAAQRRSTALAATAAPSRAAAAEQTAAKAAKVREQLRQHSSKHARQIHEQNVAIAELQQAAARRAAQQAAQRQQEEADQEQQPWPDQRPIQERQQQQLQQQQQVDPQQQRHLQQKLPLTLRNRQQLFTGSAGQQSGDPYALQQQQQRQAKQSQPQEQFYRWLQEVEVLARSEDMRDWQTAALQCREVLVPSVSGPQQAAAAWHLMVGLSGRTLTRHAQGALGGAAATLVQVSLAHNDFSMLQRLLTSNRRFVIGPRQLRDLVSVAAAAGADSGLLTDLLELAPPCQLSSRAFFVVATTCFNRRHYTEAGQVLTRLQGLGVRLSPGLVQLQQAARAAIKQTAPASR